MSMLEPFLASLPAAGKRVAQGTDWMLWTWWVVAAVSLLAAAVFSGNEIGIFSLSKVRLRLRTA